MSFALLDRWFGRLPDRINPFWIARQLLDRLQTSKTLAQQCCFSALSSQVVSLRVAEKKRRGEPIHVVFLCHMPGAWGTYDALVRRLVSSPNQFKVTLIATPYHHASFGDQAYHDGGMASLFKTLGLSFQHAYDSESGHWTDLQSLSPDFFFYQTPYDEFYPEAYRAHVVSSYAAVCYAPYYGADILPNTAGIYATQFFSSMARWFAPFNADVKAFHEYCPSFAPAIENRIRVVGLPRARSWSEYKNAHTKSGAKNNFCILWTPRWNSEARFCTFFKHIDAIMKMAEDDSSIYLIFRPHPLMFQAMKQSGDLSARKLRRLFNWFDSRPNAEIDKSGDFQPSFLRSDVIVSDTSSMLLNFAITGKPVIHTHGTEPKLANIGEELSKGFYGVDSSEELKHVIVQLKNGTDPLRETRQEIANRLFSTDAVENIVGELLNF